MQNMQKKTKICEVCLQKRNMQNMQKYSKYEEYDLHADFAGEELVNGRSSPGVELWVNCVEHRTNNFVPHVVKPPAIDWLAGPNEIPAQAAAFTHSGRACKSGGQQHHTWISPCLPADPTLFFPWHLVEGRHQRGAGAQ